MTDPTGTKGSFKRQLLLLTIAVAIVNTGFGIIFPIFPKLLVDAGGGDAADLGLIAASFGGAYLIGSPIFGNIADSVGKKKVILIGLIGFTFSNIIYILATNIAHLYLARIIEGFFAAAILPPSIALTAQLSPDNRRGRYLGYLGASQTAGLIMGPVLGGVLFEGMKFKGLVIKGSLDLPFYASALLGLIAFIWSYFQLPTDQVPKKDKLRLTPEIDSKRIPIKVRATNKFRHQVQVLPKPVYMFFLFALAESFAILAWFVISPGFVFYFYDELLLSATDFGIFVAAFGTASVIGQFFLGNISDKVGRKPVMIVGQMFSFLFYFSLLQAKSLDALIFAVIFAGIGSGLRDPAMKAWLSDLTEPENRATVFGIEAGLMSTSQIIGPIFGGFVYIRQGMEFLFFVSIAINIINIFLISILKFNKTQTKNIIELQDPLPIPTAGN